MVPLTRRVRTPASLPGTGMQELIRYLGINTRTEVLAERLLLEDSADGIIAGFYSSTRQSSAGLMLDELTIERLKVRQKQHWQSLFSSAFDEQYVRSVSMIGIRHHEIGLDSKWYIAGYAIIKAAFAEKIMEAPLPLKAKTALIVTLEKYVAVDMALALSAYSSWLID
jgi:protoglobin